MKRKRDGETPKNTLVRSFATASLAIALAATLASASITPAEAGPKGKRGSSVSGMDLGSGR